ncbi:aminotransferase class V-fold PLP-dependent enzyme [Denitrificimonas caeni]|uniref:aminotransferase class V-fold PLP-dependent enzyme n=1 Tax=Denitrificimonas caeni TaxID=521720 RepID=UPI00196325D7|nr:cysteine desulfurase [Denitrificimonas caeni]
MFLPSPWRQFFPGILALAEQQQTWLDSAATAQKPQVMIDTLSQYYQQGVANVHRAQHQPGERATRAFEAARSSIADWLQADANDTVIFTKGSTEGINLLSQALAHHFQAGDEILISAYEHHANLLPWQQLARARDLTLKVLPMDKHGHLDIDYAIRQLSTRSKVVAISALSNVIGHRQSLQPLLAAARKAGAWTVIDGAQAAVHQRPNVQQLDCDFFVCSAHKLYGPDGVGVLFARQHAVTALRHWQFGGEMVRRCDYQQAEFLPAPLGFEPGTPSTANIVAFAATLDWLQSLDSQAIAEHEARLHAAVLTGLQERGMQIIGSPNCALISFNAPQIHHSDLALLLGEQGVAVRAGHHCAMPLLQSLGLAGALRVSLAMYNNGDDIQHFFSALDQALEILQ